MFPKYFAIGALNAAIAIALGAFGAHGLEQKITDHYLEIFETGVRYHMYNALGLMLIALFAKQIAAGKLVLNGGRLIFTGMIIFSGSLYILALTSFSKLGMVTPLGGVAILAGWTCVIIAAMKKKRISE
ncbi:uncharacterized membrane protein YgdD (TMEM256/DUF423 family) [Paenibacillus endophyticus]|uniref:Uncharacterized membrane protein YgdD (TMEM256/DUF423 family) n=1 Tax=Paenibacillus endophyticus TaxID=1294268 RepID=A0A7W5CC55_9BACL|nr:DUF423 domain-containing protein [Paenibacillus endophyticus]MBB3155008.1 uncharacterized membrane protein YgdD (TMEM256/DUF423 family) [Paenibacillus endophyticus]